MRAAVAVVAWPHCWFYLTCVADKPWCTFWRWWCSLVWWGLRQCDQVATLHRHSSLIWTWNHVQRVHEVLLFFHNTEGRQFHWWGLFSCLWTRFELLLFAFVFACCWMLFVCPWLWCCLYFPTQLLLHIMVSIDACEWHYQGPWRFWWQGTVPCHLAYQTCRAWGVQMLEQNQRQGWQNGFPLEEVLTDDYCLHCWYFHFLWGHWSFARVHVVWLKRFLHCWWGCRFDCWHVVLLIVVGLHWDCSVVLVSTMEFHHHHHCWKGCSMR